MTKPARPAPQFSDEAEHDRIDRNLTNHAPLNDVVVEWYEELRILGKGFAHGIVDLCPSTPERSLALRAVEDAVHYAVAAIARNQESIVLTRVTAPADDVAHPAGYDYGDD